MLAGPSGSGKTTLLSILGCVLSPTDGIDSPVRRGDRCEATESELPAAAPRAYSASSSRGTTSSRRSLPSENVALLLEVARLRARRQAREGGAARCSRRSASATSCDSSPWSSRAASGSASRSRGRSPGNPPLVLADEPTAALDAENGLQVTELLRDSPRARPHGRRRHPRQPHLPPRRSHRAHRGRPHHGRAQLVPSGPPRASTRPDSENVMKKRRIPFLARGLRRCSSPSASSPWCGA